MTNVLTRAMTVRDVAGYLNVDVTTVCWLAHELPGFKVTEQHWR